MKLVAKVGKYAIADVARSKWALLYTLFNVAVTAGLFQLEGQSAKVVVSLISVSLILIPLVSVLFGTMYFYSSREFVELLLTQPVRRITVFSGMYLGLTLTLVTGFLLGVLVPFLAYGGFDSSHLPVLLLLLLVGSALTAVFTALAFSIAISVEDRGKGLGVSLFAWLTAAILYDGIVLLIAYTFRDYPLESPMLVLMALNPIDLGRVTLLIKADMAAVMGYTGAVFARFFAGNVGITIALLSLGAWIAAPVTFGAWRFRHKDF